MKHKNQAEPLNEIPEHIYCPACAYNLFRITSDRCPECGHGLEGLRSDHSTIPWVRRNEIGRFRAYWKTVWMVTMRHRKFCEEYTRDISYEDAQAFRWLTILHAWLPALLGVIALYINGLPAPGGGPNIFPWQARSQTTIYDQA